eukprot:g3288.t1
MPHAKWSLAKDETFDAASTRARLYDLLLGKMNFKWKNESIRLLKNSYTDSGDEDGYRLKTDNNVMNPVNKARIEFIVNVETDTTHGRSAVAKDTCINKLMDGYNSYKCTDAQEKYWRGSRKCGQYPDMIQDVTLFPSTYLDSPCGEEMKWDKSSCLQKKTIRGEDGNITANFKCTMDYTLVKTGCTEADKNIPLCKLDEHFFYDLDILQQYNDDKEPKHKTVRETYEPCSKDKTIYGDLKKKFDDYYKVPLGCITDNKGGNVDVLAASFVTRVAVLRWGLAFYYIEICFLLLTVMHAYYCTSNGGAETNLEMGRTSEKPPPPPPGQL